MIYTALLRGINVGGNSKIDMKTLKKVFEDLGMNNVKTYINSGNVIFESELSSDPLVKKIEKEIESEFKISVKVLIKDINEIRKINDALPKSWLNNDEMKSDVMFLWDEVDSKSVLEELPTKEDIDEVKYVKGAVLWRVDRDKVTRSGISKIVGTKLYKQMTVRNCNTLRKLLEMMETLGE
jgi:uncharacterized protein (DUF1697 family)